MRNYNGILELVTHSWYRSRRYKVVVEFTTRVMADIFYVLPIEINYFSSFKL